MKTLRTTPLRIPSFVKTLIVLSLLTFMAPVVSADNIAPLGTGILGVNNAVDSDAGAPHYNAGVAANINDNDAGTRVDNWFGGGTTDQGQAFSFVGIVWPSKRFDKITALNLTLATFWDGGWFGARGVGPAAGGQLVSAHLIEPSLQVSTDGGVTWTTVAHTSDYLTVMNGHGIGGGENPNPSSVTVVFTLQTAATQIDGIRIIGENGGAADGNGFLGVFELEVQVELSGDSDGDGMPDSWEQANGLNVGVNDAAGDADSDGLTNANEYAASTHPKQADTDADGLKDGDEVNTHHTNPNVADTDGDGLSDGREINESHTDPFALDSDVDGLSDGVEVNTLHTDPLASDTDGDGYADAVEVAQGSDPLSPASIPTNVALLGHGLMGTKDTLDSGPETEVELYHVGVAENINDGNLTTRVDTYNESNPGFVSFVGILWDQPPTGRIVRLELTLATFYDGGWFGVNGQGPAGGGKLTAAHLVEPRIEVQSTPGGAWSTVAHTSDYLTALNGHGVGGGLNPNPTSVKAVFTLTQPLTGMSGIRIIGTDGGVASGGFLGVFELAVHIEGPSTTDTDSDGLDDAWERQHGLTVGKKDAAEDPDNDSLTNKQEFDADTDPQNPDSDNDGLKDGAEVNENKTNPRQADTDGDGLSDGQEVNTSKTDPTKADTDGDGFTDPAEINQGSNPNSAASIPTNVALQGTGILGTQPALDSGPETPVFNSGSAANINDGIPTTRVDTYNGGGTDTVSFVGILWDKPATNPIVRLELSLAIFFDGGWFGVNGIGPGSGNTLSATEHLLEPAVQVTTDKGVSWQPVSATSDYMQAMNGHPLPAVDFGAPTLGKSTFVLNEPQTGIDGIRLIGLEGGTASGGFLGVFELAVHVNAPIVTPDITILNVQRAEDRIQFEFDSVAGKSYTVQVTGSLSALDWQTLTTLTGDGTRKQVGDSLGQSQRFYRITGQ